MTDLQYPKVTIQHLNAPEYKGTWREGLYRVWRRESEGEGVMSYHETPEEAVIAKADILKEIAKEVAA